MANKTITASTDISSLIATGLNDGNNIDINSGATLTYDVSPSVLIGQTRINDGKMLLDGANAVNPIIFCGELNEEINVNGAGTLETTLGWFIFAGTSTGLSGYTLDISSYFADANNNITADIHAGVWVETGRRINYTSAVGIAPVVGDWLFNANDNSVMGRIHSVGTGFVVVEDLTGSLSNGDTIELHTLQDNNGIDYQKSWTATVSGSDVLELDVWTKWANTYQNAADRMLLVDAGNDGRVFLNSPLSNTMIFGDNVHGRIPPTGCRFKIPMVHFCTSDLATYALGEPVQVNGFGNIHNIETGLGGDVVLKGASIGSAYFSDTQASSFYAESCCSSMGLGAAVCGTKVIIKDVMITGGFYGTSKSVRSYPFDTSDLVQGADITDCAIYYLHPNSLEYSYLGAVTSNNINFTRCIQVTCTINEEALFSQIDGITIYDMELYGGDIDFLTSSNIDARLIKFQSSTSTVTTNNAPPISFRTSTNSVFIAGIEILNDKVYTNHLFSITDASKIKIRGFHFIDDPLDMLGIGQTVVKTSGLASEIDVARVYRTNSHVNEPYVGSATSADITLSNIGNDYDGEIEARGTNVRFRGVWGGNGSLGDFRGLETDYTGSFGGNSSCFMRSDITGVLGFSFMPDSDKYPFINVVGNPKFTRDGDFDVVAGDSFTIVTDKYYGITGFTGVFTNSRASGSNVDGTDEWGANVTIEMQYDDGTGYSGTWLNVKTPTDLTSIPDLQTGAIFKVRITATGARTNLNGLMIHFTTSIVAQKNNLYPIDQDTATIEVTNLVVDSRVRITRDDTQAVLLNTTASSSTVSVTSTYKGAFSVVIRKASAVPYYREWVGSGSTANGSTSVKALQELD